jgi:co-chaperonin GroES (HSP10)
MEKIALFDPNKVNSIRALHDHVIVTDMNFDEKITHNGIIIPSGDKKLEGIHARWARVYATGPKQQDVRVGQYVLIAHGRWTRGLEIEDPTGEKTIRRVDNKDILMISDEPVQDETVGRGL